MSSMKFKLQDVVLVTAGKDKGKQGKIVKVLPSKNRVVVEGVNLYSKHIKPYADQPGRKVRVERALPTANIAIINDKGQPDRIGYKVSASGEKTRIFKKTGQPVTAAAKKAAPAEKVAPAKKAETKEKSVEKANDTKTTKSTKTAKKPAAKKTATPATKKTK